MSGIKYLQDNGMPVPVIWNKKHTQIRDSKDRYLVVYGGRDSAKSHSVAQKYEYQMSQKKFYFRGVMIRKHFNAIKDSQFETIKQIIYDSGKKRDYYIRSNIYEFENRRTGNKVIAKGLDKAYKLKSLKDPTSLWFEEPNTDDVTYNDFVKTDTGLRGSNAEYYQTIFTFNSDDGENWLKEKFFPDGFAWEDSLPENYDIPSIEPGARILHFTYHDNVFINEERIRRLERLKETDEDYYRVFCLGLWGGKIEDQVIKNYEIIPDDKYRRLKVMSNDVFYGIDWGFNDPTTLLELFVYDGDVYANELFYKSGVLPKDLISFMHERRINPMNCFYPDSARPDSNLELTQKGYNVLKVDKSILDGIKSVKSHKVYVTESSSNFRKELKFYKWQKDKEGKIIDQPIDLFNHLVDPLRYAIHNHYSLKYSRERTR